MRAFVLSGGSNRGPLQVGALGALLEAGIRPSFLVGTSVGGINAAYVSASGFSEATLNNLANHWREVTTKTIYPGNLATVAWRVLRKKDSLYDNAGIRRLIQDGLREGMTSFGQLRIPLFVPAADLRSNRLFMFGEDLNMPVEDAVLASASVPVIHPPVRFMGLQLVDGGILANVAASYAMDRGATEIYVINVSKAEQEPSYAEGVIEVAFRSVNTMIVQALRRDLARARDNEEVDLHHLYISDFNDVWFQDFSHTEEMFAAGYRAMKRYLDAPRPLGIFPDDDFWQPADGPEVRSLRELPAIGR
ncbi:MAG: patatin-like phospholipase family protein [Caldilineaceae bacterium]